MTADEMMARAQRMAGLADHVIGAMPHTMDTLRAFAALNDGAARWAQAATAMMAHAERLKATQVEEVRVLATAAAPVRQQGRGRR